MPVSNLKIGPNVHRAHPFSSFQAFWSSSGPFLRSVQIWWEKGGGRVLEYSDPNWHWKSIICDPQKPKNIWGRSPRPALREDVSFGVHLTSMCIHYQARHYMLSGPVPGPLWELIAAPPPAPRPRLHQWIKLFRLLILGQAVLCVQHFWQNYMLLVIAWWQLPIAILEGNEL